MGYLRAFTIGVATLALHSAAFAEIYETTDAEGNTVFTDAPVNAGSDVVDLPQTNIADAPPPGHQVEQQPDSIAVEKEAVEVNNPVIIHDANAEAYEERLRREQADKRRDSAVPHEVGDTDSQIPHEVGDSDSQMPHEVGDFQEEAPEGIEDYPEGVEHIRHPVETGGVHRAVHRR